MKKINIHTSFLNKSATWYLVAVSFFIMLSYSCSHKVQSTASAVAADSAVVITNPTAQQLEMGQNIYTSHCHKCHKLHLTTEFNADKWNRMLMKMAPKAKLTGDERELVRAYILNSPLHQ